MEITHEALEAIRDEVWDEGYETGKKEAELNFRLMLAQFKRLKEILEVEGDQSLLEAADLLFQEASSHREAARAGANILEQRRKELVELRAQLSNREEQLMAFQIFHDKEIGAMKLYCRDLQESVEPMQSKIKSLTDVVNELRQALLMHVKETYA